MAGQRGWANHFRVFSCNCDYICSNLLAGIRGRFHSVYVFPNCAVYRKKNKPWGRLHTWRRRASGFFIWGRGGRLSISDLRVVVAGGGLCGAEKRSHVVFHSSQCKRSKGGGGTKGSFRPLPVGRGGITDGEGAGLGLFARQGPGPGRAQDGLCQGDNPFAARPAFVNLETGLWAGGRGAHAIKSAGVRGGDKLACGWGTGAGAGRDKSGGLPPPPPG